VGKALKEMRDKKATGDVDVLYLGSTSIVGGRWFQTKDTTDQQYKRNLRSAKILLKLQ